VIGCSQKYYASDGLSDLLAWFCSDRLVEHGFDSDLYGTVWRRQAFLKFRYLFADTLEEWTGIQKFGCPLQLVPPAGGWICDRDCDLFIFEQVLSGLSRK
jgi:hypothetical protein